jgi:dolichol-phosphate hexosyltransferase
MYTSFCPSTILNLENINIPSTEVIIAALNEQEGIGPTIAELNTCLRNYRLLVVDGRSKDQTVDIAKKMGAEIFVQNNVGKGDAVAKGIEHLGPDAQYVVLTDADFTYPACHIPKMIWLLENNPSIGMVCGNRLTENLDKKTLHNVFYLGNRLIAFTHNLLNGVELKDPLTGLRVIRASLLRNWKVKSQGFDIEVELNHFIERQGFGIAEIPIEYRQRLGEKKLGVRNGQEIFRRMLLEFFNENFYL